MEPVQRAKVQMPMGALRRDRKKFFSIDTQGLNRFVRPGVFNQLDRFLGQVAQPNRIGPGASGFGERLFGLV